MKYYTPLIILVWFALIVLAILAKENDRFSKERKRILYFTYSIVALAALAEWLGIQFNGNMNVSPWVIRLIKAFDYILTPMSGGAIILQLQTKNNLRKVSFILLGLNLLFQIISIFTGWMVKVDENHLYHHGNAYNIYMLLYVAVFIIVIVEFAIYGKRFRKQNRLSLLGILIFNVLGIGLQEVLGSEVRTAYISLVICSALLYIHNSEFAQLASDDKIQEQMIRISVDPLTGISSRHAYSVAINELSNLPSLPQKLVIFSIDINGLKLVNDTLGHIAGDELIAGASKCISQVFSSIGRCYRTGGDEFIVFSSINQEMIHELIDQLLDLTNNWKGEYCDSLSLAVGFAEAKAHPNIELEKLITIADQEMYKSKAQYYQKKGIDRRQN